MESDLIVIETLKPESVFAPAKNGEVRELDKIINGLELTVRKVPVDISTSFGRSACKSLAYRIARSKTALDEMGKEFVAHLKKAAGQIDADRRVIRERLDALKDEVRLPLDKWEATEQQRIADNESAISAIAELGMFLCPEPPADAIQDRIASLQGRPVRDWGEFEKRASDTATGVLATLEVMLAGAVRRESERAELEALRVAQAERDRQQREDQAKREREERDRHIAERAYEEARSAAERKAAAEAAEAERARLAIESEKAEAVARAERAERQARNAAIAAEEARIAAETRASRDREVAVEAERKRVADALAAEEAAKALRERDQEHKRKINNTAANALVSDGSLTKPSAVLVVTLIAQGKIPNVKIVY